MWRTRSDGRWRFGTAVKFRREELGRTREGLAEVAGSHCTYLSDVERGTRNVSLVNVERLAAALGLTMAATLWGCGWDRARHASGTRAIPNRPAECDSNAS